LQWFRCVVQMGHQGSGKSTDRLVFVQAPNCVEAYSVALWLPGVKKSLGAIGPSVFPHMGKPPRNTWRWYWNGKR
jgi:hypothetical protein